MDPVIFQVGWFKLQYYGLMYIAAFATVYGLVRYRLKREERFQVSPQQINDLFVNTILGLIVGARIGYVLFYNPAYYFRHPLEIFLPFDFSDGFTFTGISGMSYHGGLIGVVLAGWLSIRNTRPGFLHLADLFAPAVPLGYTFGRLGNFINGELFGRVTESPAGMKFPLAPGGGLRHPSQLYEAFFEGIFLFCVLWLLKNRRLPEGAMLAFYLIGYGTVRFFIEYFRQPDQHLGFVWFSFSMGQLLCAAMIGAGIALFVYLKKREG